VGNFKPCSILKRATVWKDLLLSIKLVFQPKLSDESKEVEIKKKAAENKVFFKNRQVRRPKLLLTTISISFELFVAVEDKNRSWQIMIFVLVNSNLLFCKLSIEDLVDLKPITWLMGQTNWNYLILNIGKSNGWDRDGSWIKSAIKCTFEIPVQSDTQNLNSNFWYTEPRCC